MDITKKGMGIAQQPAVEPAPVVAERLSTALIRPRINEATFKKSPYGRTAASQQRAKELLNPPKPLEPKKDEKADEGIMGLLTRSEKPSEKKPTVSPADMRKYFEKEKSKDMAKYTNTRQKTQQVYTKSDESNDPWGDQGNFAGDKPVNIGGSFTRPKLEVGSLVRVNAGHLKGIGEIEEIKGDQARVWINSYARSLVVDLKDLVPYTKNEGVAGAVVGGAAGAYIGKNARSAMAGADLGSKIQDKFTTEKIKGADGKACWDGYRYNGTENGKDKCVEISEDVQNIMDALINKIIVNEAIQNKNR
jgi:hypothetical protein